jgi:hypothetical protein
VPQPFANLSTVQGTRRGRLGPWLAVLLYALALGLNGCSEEAAAPSKDAAPDGSADGNSADSGTDSDTATADVASGKCAVPAVCDDDNPCTIDGCDPNLGCTLTVLACGDDDPCTMDRCDVQTGTCLHPADACDDGNACTEGSCVAGSGCEWTATDCSDGNSCTSDGCSPGSGCINTTLDCNDFVSCTTDSCDPTSGCKHVQTTPGQCCESAGDCEDGATCTSHSCSQGVCQTTLLTACCTKNKDCDDGIACTADSCNLATGTCQFAPVTGPGCCVTDKDCDDGAVCTADSCVQSTCGHTLLCCGADLDCAGALPADQLCAKATCTQAGCGYASQGGGCCQNKVFAEEFAAGATAASGFVLVSAATAQWQTSTAGASGAGMVAPVLKGQTLPGGGQAALLRTPEITLPLGTQLTLAFAWRRPAGSGDLRLRALTAGGNWLVWQATDAATWQTQTLDISGLGRRLTTRQLRLQWEFVPSKLGGEAGLDSVVVSASCTPQSCTTAADCTDDLSATAEQCLGGTCVATTAKDYCETAATCNDGNACTADTCQQFSCKSSPILGCCLSSAECTDNNPCTLDACKGNVCSFPKLPADQCCSTTADCDDGNACTKDSCPAVGLGCAHTKTDASCCATSLDCDDGQGCTKDSCVSNSCSYLNFCCSTQADCNDGDSLCTSDICVSGLCQFQPTNAPGCCTPDLLATDFESGLPTWLTLSGISTASKWQLATGKQAHGGNGALWYGNPSKGNFDDGLTNGTASLSKQVLPTGEYNKLQFWLWMDTETGYFDDLTVKASCPAGEFVLWQKANQVIFQLQVWTLVQVDLSALGGQTCGLQLHFDTVDGTANAGQGVYVDDIALTRSCSARTCNLGSDCDDLWTASSDSCSSGLCTYSLPNQP